MFLLFLNGLPARSHCSSSRRYIGNNSHFTIIINGTSYYYYCYYDTDVYFEVSTHIIQASLSRVSQIKIVTTTDIYIYICTVDNRGYDEP